MFLWGGRGLAPYPSAVVADALAHARREFLVADLSPVLRAKRLAVCVVEYDPRARRRGLGTALELRAQLRVLGQPVGQRLHGVPAHGGLLWTIRSRAGACVVLLT